MLSTKKTIMTPKIYSLWTLIALGSFSYNSGISTKKKHSAPLGASQDLKKIQKKSKTYCKKKTFFLQSQSLSEETTIAQKTDVIKNFYQNVFSLPFVEEQEKKIFEKNCSMRASHHENEGNEKLEKKQQSHSDSEQDLSFEKSLSSLGDRQFFHQGLKSSSISSSELEKQTLETKNDQEDSYKTPPQQRKIYPEQQNSYSKSSVVSLSLSLIKKNKKKNNPTVKRLDFSDKNNIAFANQEPCIFKACYMKQCFCTFLPYTQKKNNVKSLSRDSSSFIDFSFDLENSFCLENIGFEKNAIDGHISYTLMDLRIMIDHSSLERKISHYISLPSQKLPSITETNEENYSMDLENCFSHILLFSDYNFPTFSEPQEAHGQPPRQRNIFDMIGEDLDNEPQEPQLQRQKAFKKSKKTETFQGFVSFKLSDHLESLNIFLDIVISQDNLFRSELKKFFFSKDDFLKALNKQDEIFAQLLKESGQNKKQRKRNEFLQPSMLTSHLRYQINCGPIFSYDRLLILIQEFPYIQNLIKEQNTKNPLSSSFYENLFFYNYPAEQNCIDFRITTLSFYEKIHEFCKKVVHYIEYLKSTPQYVLASFLGEKEKFIRKVLFSDKTYLTKEIEKIKNYFKFIKNILFIIKIKTSNQQTLN